MRMWRETTDMKVPLHDDFKVHFMQNRGQILGNFERTASAWQMMLGAMKPASEDKEQFESIVASVNEFADWAKSEQEKLHRLALQESITDSIDEALQDPDMRIILSKLLNNPKDDTSGK